MWQLDEPYAERSSINIEEDTEFISVFCALGKFRQLPNDILIVRFETDVIEGQPGSSPDWSDGEVVPYERHGNFYRIYDVAPGVYVARTVWDDGSDRVFFYGCENESFVVFVLFRSFGINAAETKS